MKAHSYRCDYCSNLKGESNHWWLRAPGKKPGQKDFHAAMLERDASGCDGVRAHLLGIVRGESAFQMDDAR